MRMYLAIILELFFEIHPMYAVRRRSAAGVVGAALSQRAPSHPARFVMSRCRLTFWQFSRLGLFLCVGIRRLQAALLYPVDVLRTIARATGPLVLLFLRRGIDPYLYVAVNTAGRITGGSG